MRQWKRTALEAGGWTVGSVDEFLGLSPEQSTLVDRELRLNEAQQDHPGDETSKRRRP